MGPVRLRFFTILGCALLLSACSRNWEQDGPTAPAGGTGITADGYIAGGDEAVSSVSQLPARNRKGAVEPYTSKQTAAAYEYANGYRVGAGDRLTIRVAGEADLTADYLVDAAGNISMPYVQSVQVAGLSTPQIEQMIVHRLRAGYLRDPQVSVQATALRPFYILGEVNTSGSFAYQPGITVQNAIAIAGGYNTRADQGAVLVTRKNSKGTSTYKVPVTTQIYPGDVIYVRERWF